MTPRPTPRPTPRSFTRFLLAPVTWATLLGPVARGDDWPQWFGPRRDGVWREAGLLGAFPKGGLPVRWRAAVAGGYAGPAVAGGRIYVMDYAPKPDAPRPKNPFQRITQPGVERVLCFEESTGKLLWSHAYDVGYSVSYSAGPRTTPAVDAGRVYTLGAEGDLLCLDAGDGKVVWSKHLSGEKSPTPTWGFSGQPLVDGRKLICLTGADAATGRGVMTAYDKQTGEQLWTALAAKEPGYAPPMMVNAGGVRQLVAWTPAALYGLDPETGKVYWSVPFGPVNMGLCIVTPRFYRDARLGSLLFVATQYEGSMVVKLDDAEPKAALLWKRVGKSDRKTDALHSLIPTPSLRDGCAFGIDAYGELRALDLKTGDRLWASSAATTYDAGPQKWATAFLVPLGEAGPRHLIANEHGDLILADLDAGGYHEISRTHLLDPTNTDAGRPVLWCHPALANRCVYWRNDKELICASMAAPATETK